MKSRYLLDTNHLGAALNLDQRVWGRLRTLIAAGDRIGTCIPVLCELEVGLRQTLRRDQNHRLLRKVLHEVRV
jgi:predicted nucleic acid-binding protein